MTKPVLYEKENKIGIISLNNPEKSNPFTLEVLSDLIAAFEESKANGDVCVIYRAEGKNFTFGADLKYAHEMITNPDLRSEASQYLWAWQEVTSAMIDHPGIIIVGYHGWIVGGGFEHTLGSDLRLAADDTQIMLPELDMGIFFSNASTQLLPAIVGEGRAKQMMLLGDPIPAKTALDFGLVNEVCKPDELDALLKSYAEKIVSKDQKALRLTKKIVNESRADTIDSVLFKEGRAMIETGQSDGAQKRISAFLKMH